MKITNWLRTERQDRPNCPDVLRAKVEEARLRMGDKYLCHPANRITKQWRGPCGMSKAA